MAPRRPIAETADCPQWLDKKGRREWWNLAPHVSAIHGEFTPKLAYLLGCFIEVNQQFVAAHLARRKRGEFSRMTRKGPRLWPEAVAEVKASRTSLYLAQQLGCTPLARMRILARRKRQGR